MQEQLFPFAKNRYFKKKRMRAVDFERDQAFADRKLSFLNHWVFGTGIAMGLGVERIDSDSLLVEPGMAIDPQGRYLIVDEPAVCRIKTLDGFSKLEGETALLWLSYREELLDPMFVTDDEGPSMQYAVARERFAFSLSTEQSLPLSAAEQILFSSHTLFEDKDLRVTQVIPRIFSNGGITLLRLFIESFCPEALEVELRYTPHIPGFVEVASGGVPQLSNRLRIGKGETVLSLSIRAEQAGQVVFFALSENDFTIEKRGVKQSARETFRQEFRVVSGSPLAALEEMLLARAPQELWESGPPGVPIAAVHFVRYDDKALLDDVIPLGSNARTAVPYLRESLRKVGLCYQSLETELAHSAPVSICRAPADSSSAAQEVSARQMTTGAIQLNTGMNQKAGSLLTSEEITHGLGPGAVYIEFGIEHTGTAAPGARSRALRPIAGCSPRKAPTAGQSGWKSASSGRRARPPAQCWGWRGCGCAGGCVLARAPAGFRPATMRRRSLGCVLRPGFPTRRPPYPTGAGWKATFTLCRETGGYSFQTSSRRASGGGWALIWRLVGNRHPSTSPWMDVPRASRYLRGKPSLAVESAHWSSRTTQMALLTAGLSLWAVCGATARSGLARNAGGSA